MTSRTLMLMVLLSLAGCRPPDPPQVPSTTTLPPRPTTPTAQPAPVPPPTPPAPPTSATPADEAAAREFAAKALGIDPGKLGPLKAPSGPSLRMENERRWIGEMEGRRLFVNSLTEGVWSVMLMGDGDLKADHQTTLAKAQATAEAAARRMWGDDYSRLTLASAKQLPMKQFSFNWQEQVAPDVLTGNDASVMISPGGRLLSYGEHRATRQVRLEDVRVTKEEALRIARREIAARTKCEIEIAGTTLMLSSHLLPNRGPHWNISYHMGTMVNGKLQTTAADMMLIDAMTGKVIDLAKMLGYDRPRSPQRRPPAS